MLSGQHALACHGGFGCLPFLHESTRLPMQGVNPRGTPTKQANMIDNLENEMNLVEHGP